MDTIHEVSVHPHPLTEEERELIRKQLNRMLETHHFKNSKRYPMLLRFIVEETLEGRGEFLKERLIGVRVYERPADYDTAADPIVRVTIAEIRKRIAQYYHDEEHDAEIRIELLPGRYAPEFRTPRHEARDAAAPGLGSRDGGVEPDGRARGSGAAKARSCPGTAGPARLVGYLAGWGRGSPGGCGRATGGALAEPSAAYRPLVAAAALAAPGAVLPADGCGEKARSGGDRRGRRS